MHSVVIAIPFVFLALIAGLPLVSIFRGRVALKRPSRVRRPKKSTLRVSRSQMDEDLQDLIRRR